MSSGDSTRSLEKRLGYALKQAQHALRVAMDQALRPVDLTTPQYAVLCAIEIEPGISNAGLARAAFITAQTMQGILTNLERDGYIERRPDPAHGRLLRSELTRQGRKSLVRAHAAVRAVEDALVESFGRADVERLTGAFMKCADDLRTLVDGMRQPPG